MLPGFSLNTSDREAQSACHTPRLIIVPPPKKGKFHSLSSDERRSTEKPVSVGLNQVEYLKSKESKCVCRKSSLIDRKEKAEVIRIYSKVWAHCVYYQSGTNTTDALWSLCQKVCFPSGPHLHVLIMHAAYKNIKWNRSARDQTFHVNYKDVKWQLVNCCPWGCPL